MAGNSVDQCISCERSGTLIELGNKLLGLTDIQKIAEAISETLGYPRCVIYRIKNDPNSLSGHRCYLVAGTPAGMHDLSHNTPLEEKPDVRFVHDSDQVCCIVDPNSHDLTSHFRLHILNNNINQILYIPLKFGFNEKKVRAVIVVDAIGDAKFSDLEKDLFHKVGQHISLVMNYDDMRNQKERDLVGGPISSINGLAKRVLKVVVRVIQAVEALKFVFDSKVKDLETIRTDLDVARQDLLSAIERASIIEENIQKKERF